MRTLLSSRIIKYIMAFAISILFPAFIGLITSDVYAENGTDDIPKAVSVSCGFDSMSVVNEDGSLWITSGSSTTAGDYGHYHTPFEAARVIPSNIKSVKNAIKGYAQNNTYSTRNGQTAALADDGSLWIWGINRYGTLGNGTSGGSSASPVKVDGLENVVAYDVSGLNSAAVTSDGSLYVWGDNSSYQIGNGTNTGSSSPVYVDAIEDVIDVAVGYSSNGSYACTAAIKNDGSLWMWGFNYEGILGVDSSVNGDYIKEPIHVLDNVRKVSIGDGFAVAVKNDNTLWAWGSNYFGNLGTGGTDSVSEPTQIMTDVRDVAAGQNHVLALNTDGKIYAWGCNNYGQLGDVSQNTMRIPEELTEIHDVVAIDAGDGNSVALKSDGTVWQWGITKFIHNYEHEYSDSEYVTKPVQVDVTNRTINYKAEKQERKLDIAWNDKWLEDSSGGYNHDLAIVGDILSSSAENGYAEDMLQSFGFNAYAGSGQLSFNYDKTGIDKPACSVGYKIITGIDGKKMVDIVLVCRGTVPWTDLVTDLKAKTDGFAAAGQECYENLFKAINTIADETGVGITSSNTRLFITGHSLGGACANYITMELAKRKIFNVDNIYMYTYASPKICLDQFDLKNRFAVPKAFNIVNDCGDIVHYFWNFSYKIESGFLGTTTIVPILNARMGRDIAYRGLPFNQKFSAYAKILYGSEYGSSVSMFAMLKAHFSTTYLAALMSDEPIEFAYKTFRLVSAHCPVDVTVYDESGNVCGYTKAGTAYNDESSPLRIVAIEDEKFIELPESGTYTIKYEGTNAGTMVINDQTYDAETGEVLEEKIFNDVSLEEGKLLQTEIDTEEAVQNTNLFVIDKKGDKLKTVDTSGNEILIKKMNPMTVKADKKILRVKKLKKKALTISPITVKNPKGKVSYKVVSGTSKAKKALNLNTKTGKIKVRKGTKKGTYKIKVRVKAAGTTTGLPQYMAKNKTVTVIVLVK